MFSEMLSLYFFLVSPKPFLGRFQLKDCDSVSKSLVYEGDYK